MTTPPGFRITSITAFTTIGKDNEEGVMAFRDEAQGVWMPMIAADEHRVNDLRRIAEALFTNVEWRERKFVPADAPDPDWQSDAWKAWEEP